MSIDTAPTTALWRNRTAIGCDAPDAVSEWLIPARHLEPKRFSYIDPAAVERLGRKLDCLSPAHIMATLGISANTWAKLRAGQPVRTSLAERLVRRALLNRSVRED